MVNESTGNVTEATLKVSPAVGETPVFGLTGRGPRVVVPFVKVEASQNPNAPLVATDEQQAGYARGAAVTFASLRRFNPDLRLTWFTTGEVHPLLSSVLDRCQVEVVRAEFAHRPPAGYMTAFEGCLYLLDALQRFVDDDVLYLDPDVLAVRPLGVMIDDLGHRMAALPMEFPRDEVVNGIDWAQAQEIHAALGGAESFGGFMGGEALWVPAAAHDVFFEAMERAHLGSLARFAEGDTHYSTEEHLISEVLSSMPWSSLAEYVRRIWTTASYRTVRGDESNLFLWHLPSEKDHGFRRMYDAVVDPDSWFWTANDIEFRTRAAAEMSLTGRPFPRVVRDIVGSSVRRLNGNRQPRRLGTMVRRLRSTLQR